MRGEGGSEAGSTLELPAGVRRVITLGPHVGTFGHLAWSRDGSRIAVPDSSGDVVVWDAMTAKRLFVLRAEHGAPHAVDFDASGSWIAGVCDDGALTLWSIDGSGLRHVSHGPPRNDVAFAPIRSLLATAEDDCARLWTIGQPVELVHELAATTRVMCVAFDESSMRVATGGEDCAVTLWDVTSGRLVASFEDHADVVRDVAFHPDGLLASASDDQTIKLWDPLTGRLLRTLEGHTEAVRTLSFLAGGQLLASGSDDGSVHLWNPSTGSLIQAMDGRGNDGHWQPTVVFHPILPQLACVATQEAAGAIDLIDVLHLDVDVLIAQSRSHSVTYTSAKIVLVGDSGVGKTGLGWRLTHGEFVEHASTHGQQFWLLDALGTTRSDGTQCEAVLWDLAGQPDYLLIHALFLDDADLVLLLFDPTRDDDPLHSVTYWLRQLGITRSSMEVAPRSGAPQAILVAARSDRGVPRLAADELDRFCSQRGVHAYVTTSAVTGDGLDVLLAEMRQAVRWEERPTTVTTATFKNIKDYVLAMKSRAVTSRSILSPGELRVRLERDEAAMGFTDDELQSAIGHLSNHGYVARLVTSRGEARILLAPELLGNVASSIVLEARRNPKGLGSLEEKRVLSGEYPFREHGDLATSDRGILLDSAVAMFLKHSLCFRETDPLTSRVYLVFPDLINLKKHTTEDEPTEDGVAYTAIGAVENLYASLVVLLGYTSAFTRTTQWRDHADYVVGDELLCGFRVEAAREGELDFVLYFGLTVGTPVRTLFQGLFESFLSRRNLTIQRFEAVFCPAGHQLNRAAVREQVAEERVYGFCMRCGERVQLPRRDTRIVLTEDQRAEVRGERREVARRSTFEQVLFRLNTYVAQEGLIAPSCFVSYAWGRRDHERWVEELANDLLKAGIVVVLDRWENARIGRSIPRFVERMSLCDRVVVVGTPLYRAKYENTTDYGQGSMRGSVAAAEGDLINSRMTGSELSKETVYPVLLAGTEEESFPPLLQRRVHADFRDRARYAPQCLELVLSVWAILPRDPIAIEVRRLLDEDSL